MSYKRKWLKSVRYEVKVKTQSPLSIKDGEDNIKRDNKTGKFILPGASITGAFRHYYEQYLKVQKSSDGLFSNTIGIMNNLYCYDSLEELEGENNSVMASRPALKIDAESLTGDSLDDSKKSGSFFSRTFVPEETKFTLVFELNQYDESIDFIKEIEAFEYLLQAFIGGEIPLGGHKQIGFGIFDVEDITKKATDLTKYKEIIDFMKGNTKEESILERLKKEIQPSSKIHLTLEAETLTPFLIKAAESMDHKKPDAVNMTKPDGTYVIPGSSLKGVLRNRTTRIIKSFNVLEDTIIEGLFGQAESKDYKGHNSRLNCFDTSVVEAKTGIYNKIKLDHFTGGVMQGALVDEEVVMGKVIFQLILNRPAAMLDRTNKSAEALEVQKEVGLLLLVLQELSKAELSIGSGYSIGRGYFTGKKLTLKGNETYVYNFDNSNSNVEEIFDHYIKTLWGGTTVC